MDNLDELLDDLAVRKSYGGNDRVASSRVDLDELESLMNDLKGEEEPAPSRNSEYGGANNDLDDLMSSLGGNSSTPSRNTNSGDGLDDLMSSLSPSSNPSYGGNHNNNNSNSNNDNDLENLMNSLTPETKVPAASDFDIGANKDIFDLIGGGSSSNNSQQNNSSHSQPMGAAGQTNLSDLETDILMELQRLRSDPSFYANLLEQRMKPSFKGKWLVMKTDSNQLVQMETVEGVSAVDEAIQVLKTIGSIGSISHGKGLSDAAREAVTEHGKYGEMKSSALERLTNYGKFDGQASEMVSYGVYSAQEVIMQHLVSDGDPNRGNRKTMLDHQKRYCGIGVGEHKSQFQRMYSLVFAQDWMDWDSVH